MVGNIPFFFCLVSLSFIKFVTITEEVEEEELCKSRIFGSLKNEGSRVKRERVIQLLCLEVF